MATLLVVDNDVVLCRALKRAMSVYGHAVFTAKDAETALEIFQEERPQHVLVDRCLLDDRGVDRSGFALIRRVVPERVNVALVTGFADEADAAEAWELGIEVFEKPLPAALLAEWIASVDFTQPEPCSGRREVVPRTVLFITTSTSRLVWPNGIRANVVTKVDHAYEELKQRYDIVLVDGAHPKLEMLVAVAAEHGCCVYVLSSDPAIHTRVRDAGAVGAIAPCDIPSLNDVPLPRPSRRVPVLPWIQATVHDVVTTPMPHAEKMERIQRLLLEDQVTRHGSERVAAAAAGIPRPTLKRHMTPRRTERVSESQAPTSPDAESVPMSKHGHSRKR